MNDQQIYALMAKTPDIRAVQIADALDQDLKDVSAALRSLVEVGDVIKHSGEAPNGQPAQLYNLSSAYRNSRDGQALLGKITVSPTSPAPQAPVAVPVPQPAQIAVPVFAKQTEPMPTPLPNGSRVARGLAYLAKHMSASDDEMRTAMGLTGPVAPVSYLASAIKTGKLHKDGSSWKPGRAVAPGASAAERERLTPAVLEGVGEVASAVCGAGYAVETGEVPAGTIAPVDVSPAQDECGKTTSAPVFRCGYWSDGVLELQRDGSTIARLEQREGEQLVGFFQRMLVNAVPVQTSARARTE